MDGDRLPTRLGVLTLAEVAFLLCCGQDCLRNDYGRVRLRWHHTPGGAHRNQRRLTRARLIAYMNGEGIPLDIAVQGTQRSKNTRPPRDFRACVRELEA